MSIRHYDQDEEHSGAGLEQMFTKIPATPTPWAKMAAGKCQRALGAGSAAGICAGDVLGVPEGRRNLRIGCAKKKKEKKKKKKPMFCGVP